MHLEASHESFMEGTMLGKASENMAVKGNSYTISEWVSSMTTDRGKGLEHTGKISVFRVQGTSGQSPPRWPLDIAR